MSSGFGILNLKLTLAPGQKIKIKLTGELWENNLPHISLVTSAISSEIGGRLRLFARAVIGRATEVATENSVNSHK